MKKDIFKNIITEKGESEFEIRFFDKEGVGLLTTKSNENYLIHDSIDYWYDLIQNGYPRKKKCTCKNTWFKLEFVYTPREGNTDIKEMKINRICSKCSKLQNPIEIIVKQSFSLKNINQPLEFCKKPNIKYKFSELSGYWNSNDLKLFLEFLFRKEKMKVYCWYVDVKEKKYYLEKVSFEDAIKIITINHRYLNFYFSSKEINISKYEKRDESNQVHVEDDIWRKEELIQLDSPIVLFGYGNLFCIKYCTQFLDKDNILNKSKEFEIRTNNLREWLKQNFETGRGKNCYDGVEAYKRVMQKLKK